VSAAIADPGEPRLAPPESLLGRLQRGRGAGFLGALREQPSAVWPLLSECITRDPRWDRQLEERGYYADLAIGTRMDLAPLADFLLANDDPDPSGCETWLAVAILGTMARRGSAEAAHILRDYVSFGQWWGDAVDALQASPFRHLLSGLDVVICHRFPADEDLAEQLGCCDGDEEPWQSWRQTNPRLAKVFTNDDRLRAERRAAREQDLGDFAALPLHQLLSLADSRNWLRIRRAVAQAVQPSDVELLASHLSAREPFAAAAAVAGLGKLGSPAAWLPLKRFLDSTPQIEPPLRGAVVRDVSAFPAELTLDLGRSWFDDQNGLFRTLGQRILERHASAADVPRLRSAVAASLERRDMWRLCAVLDAFQRFPGLGYVPELRQAYDGAPYSRARTRAARALRVTSPDRFQSEVAFECLWDCEAGTRELACHAADPRVPGAADRLTELAGDPLEEDEVRQAAAGKLAGRTEGGPARGPA
jgi:hypothetical protein